MLKITKEHGDLVMVIFLLSILLVALYSLVSSQIVSKVSITIVLFVTMSLVLRKHWKSYLHNEYTREKAVRNLALDLLGLLLSIGAAIFMGGQVGQYIGNRAGLWPGLLAGFLAGFLAAWGVRSLWERVAQVRM